MRSTLSVLMILALVAGGTHAQKPQDGDLVFCLLDNVNFQKGAILYLDPNNPTSLNTLTPNVAPNHFQNWIRMAPNNADLVVSETDNRFSQSNLVRVDFGGFATTVVQGLPGTTHGFALDGDDTWIVANDTSSLFGVKHATGATTSFILNAPGTFNDVAILREGTTHYAIAVFTSLTSPYPKILAADRNGVTSTLFNQPVALNRIAAIEVDPKTGDFLTGDFDGPTTIPPEPGGGVEVNRVTQTGMLTTLQAFVGANAVKVDQDDTLWVVGFVTTSTLTLNAVMHYDLKNNTVITLISMATVPSSQWSISGLEIYGSRAMTCNGQGGPGTSIDLDLRSQNTRAPGAAYQIACSFGRRPGMRLSGGPWLHLNLTDSLFLLTVQNLAPAIFQNFAGVVDAFGAAHAVIKLPKSFPANVGLTVFCAGVVYDLKGIVQVTNTHWFEI